jgi:hypothetical protein
VLAIAVIVGSSLILLYLYLSTPATTGTSPGFLGLNMEKRRGCHLVILPVIYTAECQKYEATAVIS